MAAADPASSRFTPQMYRMGNRATNSLSLSAAISEPLTGDEIIRGLGADAFSLPQQQTDYAERNGGKFNIRYLCLICCKKDCQVDNEHGRDEHSADSFCTLQ
jgi:hypothetical protein